MRIHAIQTGTVQVHERQRSGRGSGLLRFAHTLLDPEWSEPLPIHAWAIEHPEGIIVIDTGETARTGRPGYFPRWHPYFRLAVREHVEPEEEIGPRLRQIGLSPDDVRWVVMTHLHTDHAGGLHHFPRAEILVSRKEHRTARGLAGKLRGYLPHRWPQWFDPTPIDFDTPHDSPARSVAVTDAGDVRVLETPGHTAGHVSVIVEEGPHAILFAGDASYTEANMVSGTVDGVASMGAGEGVAAETLRGIRKLAATRPMVYLPSHDPGAARRLAERRVVVLPDGTAGEADAA